MTVGPAPIEEDSLRTIFGRTTTLAAAMLCGVVVSCTSTASRQAPKPDPVVIPLKPYVSLLRVVGVTMKGKTRSFLFDTGGGLAFVTPELAKEIGCEPFGRLTGFRNDGARIDASRCPAADFEIGSFRAHVDDVGVFDLMSLLKGLPELGGLIGLPAFEGETITIDLASNRLIVETPESAAMRIRSMKEIRVRPAREPGGAGLDLFVAVDTPRGPIWLELDSGNLDAVRLSPPAIDQLGVDLRAGDLKTVALPISGYGPVEVSAVRRDIIYDGLLDARFMQGFVFTIDLAHMRAWMAPHEDADGS